MCLGRSRAQMAVSSRHQRNNEHKNQLTEEILNIYSHNQRGLTKPDHMEELMHFLNSNKAYAACLQETWKLGDNIEEHEGNIIINHGPPTKLCRRGSLGVSIVISRQARDAWERAGAQPLYFGMRIIATRLHVEDKRGKISK